MTETRKLRVFLCHSSQDKPIVRELYQRLNAEGWIDPWLDEEKLLPGQDWDMEIEKAVETADVVIIFLSNNSVTKEGYVQRELRKILDVSDEKPESAIFIIPLRLEDCLLPRRLKKWQFVDYFPQNKYEWAYARLLLSLRDRAATTQVQNEFSKDISPQSITKNDKVVANKPEIVVSDLDWLKSQSNKDNGRWVSVWQTLYKQSVRFGTREQIKYLADVGIDWLKGREDNEKWYEVWQILLQNSDYLPLEVIAYLNDIGINWLRGREEI